MKTLQHLLTLGLALGATSFAKAQTVNPVPAPTIITTAPYTITTSGYYQLGANINVNNTTGNIITINVANVTLDFAGHYISGPVGMETTSTLIGVNSADHANLVIQNGTISHCYEGIILAGSGTGSANYNQLVQNMLITNTSHIGINYLTALNSRIVDNVITNIGGATPTNGTGNYGVFVQGNPGSFTIEHNVIGGITGPNGSTSPNLSAGVYVNGTSALLSRNKFFSSGGGIYFTSTALGKFQDNLTINVTTPFTNGGDAGGNN